MSEEVMAVPSLGPFALKPVELASLGLRVHEVESTGGGRYSVNLRLPSLGGIRSIPSIKDESRLSPTSRVTLSSSDRRILGIPPQAVFFAFAYALRGVADASTSDRAEFDPHNACVSFCCLCVGRTASRTLWSFVDVRHCERL